jgi:transposase-like protein
MTQPIPRDAIDRRRVFDAEVIELCVRWYITYRLSYRDLVEIMAERGVQVAHTTILRWVLRYVPEYEKRWRRFLKPVGTSWRVDETYVSIRGRWHYLYRAVDKHGKTVGFLLRPDRGVAAALAFFRKALGTVAPKMPGKITLDGHRPSRRALWLLRREHPCWRNVRVRTNRYLNNIVEQDLVPSSVDVLRWPASSHSPPPLTSDPNGRFRAIVRPPMHQNPKFAAKPRRSQINRLRRRSNPSLSANFRFHAGSGSLRKGRKCPESLRG